MTGADPRRQQLLRPGGSLFASDVYQRSTSTYAWAANQTAHLGLGALGAACAVAWVPWLAAHPWVLFAVYPFKELRDVMLARRRAFPPFAVATRELVVDAVTDLVFVSLGIAVVALAPWSAAVATSWLAAVAVAAFVAWRAFGPARRAFDKSGLPYLFRLGAFRADWQAAERPVAALMAASGPAHLLLEGPAGCGRTTLAVGIGCELVLRPGYVRYASAARLQEELAAPATGPSRDDAAWLPAEADTLIVDDLRDADPVEALATALRERRVVWVAEASADVAALARRLATALGQVPAAVDVGAMHYQPLAAAGRAQAPRG